MICKHCGKDNQPNVFGYMVEFGLFKNDKGRLFLPKLKTLKEAKQYVYDEIKCLLSERDDEVFKEFIHKNNQHFHCIDQVQHVILSDFEVKMIRVRWYPQIDFTFGGDW